ncbi:hypothetical protein [Chryseobacterium fistulae]|uniref:Uncharacterized protein n=1 Tax=Chryseobacterium fistulae TaxID=2675058 RepID=A0A6N4XV11_9FLAO|nr:hypothetical protein [Chryseobacterium fistulae]CAA7391371.1 hypothetical protein CHRY9393_02900 [Chryseobacterium fistulae]
MKNLFVTLTLTISGLALSQVGINTVNPQGAFHVDGAKDNPNTGTPTVAQQGNDVIVTSSGNVGIGTTEPTNKLTIISTSTNTGLQLPFGAGVGMVLSSDASGNTLWTTNTAVTPTAIGQLPASNADIPLSPTTTLPNHYINSYIDLLPGKWLVNIGSTTNISNDNNKSWLVAGLSDSNTSYSPSSDIMLTHTGRRIAGATDNYGLAFLHGTIAINNSGTTTKRYFLWVGVNFTDANSSVLWLSPFGNINNERYFYALPIN